MSLSTPWGHLASIGWAGDDTAGLRAEYGRLRRCLEGRLLSPEGQDVTVARRQLRANNACSLRSNTDDLEADLAQVALFQRRVRHVKQQIYIIELARGQRLPYPTQSNDPDRPDTRYLPYVRLMRENLVTHNDEIECEEDTDGQPQPAESLRTAQWIDQQIHAMGTGTYEPAKGKDYPPEERKTLALEVKRPLDPRIAKRASESRLRPLKPKPDPEEAPDDEAYLKFLDTVTAALRKGSGMDQEKEDPTEVRLKKLKSDLFNLKRLIHASELEVFANVNRKAGLEYQHHEQTRVSHYYFRMTQIKAQLESLGLDVDLIEGDGEVEFDEKRSRDPAPTPAPEQPLW